MLPEVASFLPETIDEALSGLFSEKVRDAFYEKLRNTYSLRKEEIPNRLDDFIIALQRLFDGAAKPIERAIAKRLYMRLGFAYREVHSYGLIEYVNSPGTGAYA